MSHQSKVDSFMEAVSNTGVGFVLSLITWQFVAWGFGIPMTFGENLKITGIFTVVSISRSYIIRRVFNGRTIWQAIRDAIRGSRHSVTPSAPEGQLIKGS